MPTLLVKENNNIIDKIPLYKDVFFIGRALENDLILTDTASSRRHSRIFKDNNSYYIEDMASANGTSLNGQIIRSRQLMRNGDVVRIGDTELVFQDEQQKSGAQEKGGGTSTYNQLGTSQIVKPVSDIAPEMDLEKSIEDLSASLVQERSAVAQKEDAKKDTNFQILYKLGKILTSTGTLDELLNTGMELVMNVVKADRGVLQIKDETSGKLVTKVTKVKGEMQRLAGNIDISSTISNKVINEKVAIMTADAKCDPRFHQGQSIVSINIRSAICVPLWDEKFVRGIMYVDNLSQTNCFTEQDLDLLTAVAHQIAIGIKKEQLNDKIRREAIVRSNLERFHSPEELEMIMKHDQTGESLSMRETEASVLFSDIVSFTPISEKMTPAGVAAMLNTYFSMMTRIIFKNKGSVNKYIGDGIMATFGAFDPNDTGAENALRAGCEMIMALKKMHEKGNDPTFSFQIRIGINTGPVVVGMLGPIERMEFTVLGDTVNVASRFESVARPMSVCFGDNTFKIAGKKFRVTRLEDTKLKGKAETTALYGILLNEL